MPDITLYKAAEVTSGQEVADTYVPANNKAIEIILFHGQAAYSANSAVKLVWDFGGAGEEVLWSIKGGGDMPAHHIETFTKIGDGVKKIAVTLDNGEAGNIFMSGLAHLKVEG